jgi:superkiller protein 3
MADDFTRRAARSFRARRLSALERSAAGEAERFGWPAGWLIAMDLPDAESYNRSGKKLWEAGEQEQAIALWREGLERHPDAVELLTSLAWGLGQRGKVAEGKGLAERAVAARPEDPEARHVLGVLLFLEGEHEAAVVHYQEAIEQNRGGPAELTACLHRDLGDAYYTQGDFAQAARQYQTALSSGGDKAYCHLWLGWSKHQLGDLEGAAADFAQAARQYQTALSSGGDKAYCHLWLGWSKHQLGDLEGAAADFAQAESLSPEWHEPLYAQGQLCCAQGDYRRARYLLERAIELCPGDDEEGQAAAACELGNALRGLGDLRSAMSRYQEALALDPTHAVARFNLGLAYGELGDHEAALAAFDVAVQLDPDDPEIQVERGRARAALGRHDDALEAYDAALDMEPDNAEAMSGMGLAYYSLGLYDTAAEHYRSAAQRVPHDPWPRFNLALCLEGAGRHGEADQAMGEAWDLGQENAALCLEIARAITAHGRDPEAAAAAGRRACALDPESAEAHDALATALYSAGDYDGALTAAREAFRLLPEAAEYVYHLGLIHEARGDLLAARESFEHALVLSPGFEEAEEALRRLGDLH